MLQRLLRPAYARLGPRYPRAALGLLFAAAYPVGFGGVALLTLYADGSAGEFLRIGAAVIALALVENVLGLWLAFQLLRPAGRWLGGERSPETAVPAWCAVSGLPIDFLSTHRTLAIAANVLPISAYATWELELPLEALPIVAAGACLVLAYGIFVRFFGMELLMRPVLEDLSCDLPDGAKLGGTRVPLRWKLLLALPVINVITGVLVAGLSADGTQTIEDLGADVLIALAVAFTLSLELTLLLSRAVSDQIEQLRRGTERVAAGDLTARVPVLASDETGALAASFNQMVSGQEERERLREAFGAFVDPDVVQRVLEVGSTDLEGEEVEVSILFLDIRGFTALAERSSAREMVRRLNEFYGLVVPALERHGGHANKFIGDGLLGVFGAPHRYADHADRAVLAALDIAALVRQAYRGALQIGVGVNSGPVLAGTVGGGGHVEFTVIGDAVNTAARVEEATKLTGDDVLITEDTRRLLSLPFDGWVQRPGIELKGKTRVVPVFAPGGASDGAGAASAQELETA